jgi:hypothetical protein
VMRTDSLGMLGEPSFFTACMMICTVAPGCTPVMRPIGSARILRKGTLHGRNGTKMSDGARMEGPVEAERGNTRRHFSRTSAAEFCNRRGRKKYRPPHPEGMKGGCSPQNSAPLRYLSGELQMENGYTAIRGSSRRRIFRSTRSRGNWEQARESENEN